uniref:Zinc transporter ZIP1 n=1 Tax=Plectus sambesii TaxID=2011161 RepID=A0A914W5S2_9BILA
MSPLMLKIILMLVMVVITLVAGLVPVRVLKLLRKNAALASTDSQHRSASLTLCLLTCFSGGVFLATCFLDLLPDVNEHLRELKKKMDIHSEYPFAELLSCVGFFLVFGLEEIVLKLIPGLGHSHKRESSTPPHLHVQRSSENLHVNTPNDLYPYQSNAKNERAAGGNASCLLSDGRHNEDDELSKGPLLSDDLSPPPVAVLGNARIQSRGETRSTPLSPDSVAKAQTNGGPLPTKRSISTNAAVNRRTFRDGQLKATSESDLETRQMLRGGDRDRKRISQQRSSMVVGDLCSDEQCIGQYGSLSAIRRSRSTSELGGASIYYSVYSVDNPLYASLEMAEPERCEMNCEGRDEHPPILMTSRPHAHSHGVRSVTFVLALSFHSVLEGLAFGVQKNSSEVTTLFLSLMIHKSIVAF